MIAPIRLPEIPPHLSYIIERYAERTNRTFDEATLHLLTTICCEIERMERGEIRGLAVIRSDGTTSELFFD